MNLNEDQTKAYKKIKKFLKSDKSCMLMYGPGGTGKSTTITSVLMDNKDLMPEQIYFCAFTNKATNVLRKMITSKSSQQEYKFETIHKLLRLEPIMSESKKGDGLSFYFDINALEHLKDIKLIILDECSTIDSELLDYLKKTQHQKNVKYIFLGDYWQLPPVGEELSPVFDYVNMLKKDSKASVTKLNRVMRANSTIMNDINRDLITFKDNIPTWNKFIMNFPKNLIPTINKVRISYYDDFIDKYIESKNADKILLTYSRKNCRTINLKVENKLTKQKLTETIYDTGLVFKKGDKCVLDRPVDIYTYCGVSKDIELEMLDSIIEQNLSSLEKPNPEYKIRGIKPGMLYNGEVFNVLDVKDIRITTPFNQEAYQMYGIMRHMNAQLLKIADDQKQTYQIVNINQAQYTKLRGILRRNLKYQEYLRVLSEFHKIFPILDYGYCLTTYKCQGSEFDEVFLNLSSFFHSLKKEKNVRQMYRAIYTGITRAKSNIYLYF